MFFGHGMPFMPFPGMAMPATGQAFRGAGENENTPASASSKSKEVSLPETCVIGEAGSLRAEIVVYVRWRPGGEAKGERHLGPVRRTRPEALKDCIELRKVAEKGGIDPTLSKLKQRSEELEDTTWTHLQLGGKQLEGAESHPRAASGVAPKATSAPKPAPGGGSHWSANVVEVADLEVAVAGAGEDREAWAAKAKIALQQLFKRFGPVLSVKMTDESGSEVSGSVRFAGAKSADAAMQAAMKSGGVLSMAGVDIRVRQPGSSDKARAKFPAPRAARLAGPSKKKQRPNERFKKTGDAG
ncbi:unnamed protein product, partial [Polarella glacialis]